MAVCAMRANGKYVPPVYSHTKEELINGAFEQGNSNIHYLLSFQ